MNALWVIGDRETVLAFALGGVPGRVVEDPGEARDALEAMVREATVDRDSPRGAVLLLITHAVARGVRERLDQLVLAGPGPLVLEISGFADWLASDRGDTMPARGGLP